MIFDLTIHEKCWNCITNNNTKMAEKTPWTI